MGRNGRAYLQILLMGGTLPLLLGTQRGSSAARTPAGEAAATVEPGKRSVARELDQRFASSQKHLLAAGNALGVNSLMFHGDRQRTGWNANETILTPDNVATAFGKLWDTGQLDTINIGGTDFAPHMYASPLYVDQVLLTDGQFAGQELSVVVAATGNGYVYAVNALEAPGVPAGMILWRTFLGMPSRNIQDSGVPIGVLGTPAIDLDANPPTIYVASDVTPTGPTDPARTWKLFGIDLTSGTILPGWPLDINNDTLGPINENGPATFGGARIMSQRGGLNLSLDRSILYVPFGSYNDGGAGWMVAVDTGIFSGKPALASAFSGAPWTAASANAGMWASGGSSVDNRGNVFIVTGNSSLRVRAERSYVGGIGAALGAFPAAAAQRHLYGLEPLPVG